MFPISFTIRKKPGREEGGGGALNPHTPGTHTVRGVEKCRKKRFTTFFPTPKEVCVGWSRSWSRHVTSTSAMIEHERERGERYLQYIGIVKQHIS